MTCVTVADEKHQIIIDTKAFGVGQEQVTLKPMVESIKQQFDEDKFVYRSNVILPEDITVKRIFKVNEGEVICLN